MLASTPQQKRISARLRKASIHVLSKPCYQIPQDVFKRVWQKFLARVLCDQAGLCPAAPLEDLTTLPAYSRDRISEFAMEGCHVHDVCREHEG